MGSAEKFSHMRLNVYHDDSIGDRKYMEDIVLIAANQTDGSDEGSKSKSPFACFFVFDGHGGVEAAKFVRNTLLSQLLAQENFLSDDDEKTISSIKQGFLKTQELMFNDSATWPKYNGRTSTSGTTVSMVMVRKRKMFVAHVGDSRVVLGEKDKDGLKPIVLTEDHKPDDPKELKRIHEDGGDVIIRNGVPRVVWKRKRYLKVNDGLYDLVPFLAVSRSLGDFWSFNPEKKVYTVSPEPDVSVHSIDPSKFGCIIMASDGLWNVIRTDAVMAFVQKNCKSGNASNLNFASGLVNDTISTCSLRKLKADNTSVIVICPEMEESDCQHDDDYFTVKIISNSSDLKTDILMTERSAVEKVVTPERPKLNVEQAFVLPLPLQNPDADSKAKNNSIPDLIPGLEPPTMFESDETSFENEDFFKKADQILHQISETIINRDNDAENGSPVSSDETDSNDYSICENFEGNSFTELKCPLVEGKSEVKSFDLACESSMSIPSPLVKPGMGARLLKRKSKSYSESESKRVRRVAPGPGSYPEGCNGRAPLETLQVCS